MITCVDNVHCSKSKVQSKHTKQEQSKHGTLHILGVGSGAVEEKASYAERSQPPCALWCNREKHQVITKKQCLFKK